MVDVAAAARVKAEIIQAGDIWKDLEIWTFSLPPDRDHDAVRRASSDLSRLLSNPDLNFLDGVGGGEQSLIFRLLQLFYSREQFEDRFNKNLSKVS